MRYVAHVTGQVTANKFKEVLEAAFPAIGGQIMQMFDAEWIEKGMQKGMEKGLQQGLQQGRQEALAELTLRLLQRRIGTVPEDIKARIQALPAAPLEDLGEACLDFQQADDVTAWLEKHELPLQP